MPPLLHLLHARPRFAIVVRHALSLSIAGLYVLAGAAFAQVTVDTEEQRRRAQQEAEERLSRQQAPDVHLSPAAPTVDTEARDLPVETPCVRIDRVQLDGERRQAFTWLDTYLAGYAGRCIGPQGINQIVQRTVALIVAKGYSTTRIGIPPEQDLASGSLRLVLIPGVIRAIRIEGEGEAPERNWRSAFPVRPGDLLNLRDIEQGLEQMKRTSSQDVSIDIVPEGAPGESDIVLTVQRGKPWRLGLTLDDAGAKATGRLQTSLTASLDNLLGINDLLSLTVNNDADHDTARHGTRGHSLQYSVPWGYWTLSLADSASHYLQTIQGMNETFRSSGNTQNQEIKLQRVVYRDQTAKTTLQFRALRRYTRSYIEDTEILNQRRRSSAAELGVAHRQYLGDAQIDLALAHRQGVSWFGGQSDAAGHSADAPTPAYRMQTLDFTAVTPFKIVAQPVRWLATLHGQTTNDVLYAVDHIAIGNRYTVRGFDGERTLAAERGWFLRNELEVPLGDSGQAAYAGIDHGQVSGPSAQALAGRRLTGAVLGLRGAGHGFNYDLFAGWALAKPDGFGTRRPVAGFLLSYQL
ncbi:ShlB/FhaC/HecB family hemolysin secretion/activation protein [Propionivibrio sp.]|uniref:ShlB/FhaC/HecB family hemolysin secretion/activation protein n=1 Tax=Propionivibrio sp. TaxID=2212460 RepID=UPI002638F618|nr:ShlB/FhaC/HecB family hemolysin secretion/activation protein [Propionivibrio sp.]